MYQYVSKRLATLEPTLPRLSPFHQAVVVQLDQSIERAPICLGKIPCVTPRGKYWLSRDPWSPAGKLSGRLLVVKELAMAQGVGNEHLEDGKFQERDGKLQDLVGNSFTAPTIGALIIGAIVSTSWSCLLCSWSFYSTVVLSTGGQLVFACVRICNQLLSTLHMKSNKWLVLGLDVWIYMFVQQHCF